MPAQFQKDVDSAEMKNVFKNMKQELLQKGKDKKSRTPSSSDSVLDY